MPKAYFRRFQFVSNEQGLDIASIIGASARNLVYYRVSMSAAVDTVLRYER